jgi:Matrixin/Fibronectin type III domain
VHALGRISLAAPLLLLAVSPAAGTTFVRMSDAELVKQAPLVVEATVLSVTAAPVAAPRTDITVQVKRVLKGWAPGATAGATLVVRQFGGPNPDGISVNIWGIQPLAPGDQALLFLHPNADATWAVAQVIFGAFRQVRVGDRTYAVRNLDEARELAATAPGAPEPLRDWVGFVRFVEERGRGRASVPDYFVAPSPSVRLAVAAFSLFTEGSPGCGDGSHNLRWPGFPGAVAISAHQSGQPGLAGGGFSEFQTALAAWTADAGTNISYGYGGTTAAARVGGACQDAIFFGDPANEIAGTFAGAGVVAIGGPCFSCSLHSFNAQNFHPIQSVLLVTQDGIDSIFASNGSAKAAELFAHELGHTLGLAHSGSGSALMFPTLHNPPIGASLSFDDRAAIGVLYGTGAPPAPPAPPSNLVALALSTTQIQLGWSDNSTNETSFRIEMRTGLAAFVEIGAGGANSTGGTVTALQAGTTYDFRVRARHGSGDSAYSNIASATTLTPGTPPSPPTNLTALALSPTSVSLQWSDNSADETSFRIEQLGQLAVEIGSVGANVTAATVQGLAAATLHTFRVRARNASGDSAYSNQASATTPPLPGTAPNPPTNLVALALSSTEVRLTWTDAANNEDSFRIEMRTGAGAFAEVDVAAANSTSRDLSGLAPATLYEFRVRARNTTGDSEYSNVAVATTTAAPCDAADPDAICLNDGRFKVQVAWQTPDLQSGSGHPVRLSADSAYFWFFLPDNIEIVLKVLDGCGINQRYWVFATGLTNVFVRVTVTDQETLETKVYENPQDQPFRPLQDTGAFATCSAPANALAAVAPVRRQASPERFVGAAACSASATALCLRGSRFLVEAFWRTPQGESGLGQAVPLTADSGYFWFFDEGNVEVVTKVIDACAPFDRFWVFAGGLTNVEVRLRVTDTVSSAVREYLNPLNHAYDPLQDTDAFRTCP